MLPLLLFSLLAVSISCTSSEGPFRSVTSAKASLSDSDSLDVTGQYLICAEKSAGVLAINDSLHVALIIAPEDRCSPYERSHYSYPQSVEQEIADRQGLVSLYTGRTFASLSESDIEHIVALSEAHDSGMCAASRDERKAFARDLNNLTLAAPNLNRHQKRAKDAAEWLPPLESAHCWFAAQVVTVKAKYDLTVDQAEYDALKAILDGCLE